MNYATLPPDPDDLCELPLFSEDLLDSDTPLLIACLRRSKESMVLEQDLCAVAKQFHPMLHVCIAEACEDNRLRNRFYILGTPTYLLIENGHERERLLGKADARILTKFIHDIFDLD